LKNCGGKMAEGGTDGEFIANVYDDYDAEVGTTVTSMYAKGGMVVSDNDILDALSGFNNGLTLTSISEVIGLSNYRFGKYATESQMKNLQRKINNLIKNGYVKEGGVGYMLTNKIYSPSESKFAYGGMMAKGGIIAHGLKTGDKIISGRIIGTTIMVYNANNDEYAKIDLENGKRTKVIYDKKTKKYIEEKKDGGMMAKGGRVLVGKFDEQQLRNKEDKKAVEKAQKETGLKYIDSKIVKKGGKMMLEVYLISDEEYHNSSKFADGGMMAKGGMTQNEKYDLLYNFVDEKMIEGDEQAERIINGELPNSYYDLYDFVDEKMIEGDSQAAKLLNTINKKVGKVYRIKGYYSDGFREDLGDLNDLSKAIEVANAEQMQNPEYETVKVLEEDDYDTIVYYSTNDKKALGGFFGNSRYNTGRSWHLDHARHNKKESYEKPLNKRSRRFKRK
jgi:hypothetical protein